VTHICSTLAVLAMAAPGRAETVSFPATPDGQIEFVLPSNNIGCVYTPAGGTPIYKPEQEGAELQCDRVAPTNVRVVLGGRGPAKRLNNVGEASCCSSGPVLQYGQSWSAGPFTCESKQTGLTCTRARNGFSVSRAEIKVY